MEGVVTLKRRPMLEAFKGMVVERIILKYVSDNFSCQKSHGKTGKSLLGLLLVEKNYGHWPYHCYHGEANA